MRILEVSIDGSEQFGIFNDRSWELNSAPLTLIHGPNEAGKSTLLQLIRELLFGFKDRGNPYRFESHSGDMAATGLMEMSDGRRIRFRRRKGRKGTVLGEIESTGERINETDLQGLLGHATAELYQHVFGFSLQELARGEESLRSANLNEALFGGGLGSLTSLQGTRLSLEKEADALFSPRAKTRTINRLQSNIKRLDKELREATLKPRDFEAQQKALNDATGSLAEITSQRDDVVRRQAHIARQCNAVAVWRDLQSAREEFDAITVPDGLSAASGPDFDRLRTEATRARENLESARFEVEETESGLASLQPEPALLMGEATIRALQKRVSVVEKSAEQLPGLQTECRTKLADTREQLRQLNSEWHIDDLDDLQTNLAQRDAVERWANERAELDRRQQELSSLRPRLEKQLADARQKLERAESVPADPVLAGLVSRRERFTLWCEQLTEAQAGIADRGRSLDTQRQHLTGILLSPDCPDSELATFSIPLETDLTAAREEWAAAASACDKAIDEVQRQQKRLTKQRDVLASLDRQERAPDAKELDAARRRRDDGWSLIRQQFIDLNKTTDFDERIAEWTGDDPDSVPNQFEQAVSAADRLADERQSKAELVARREQLAAELDEQQDVADRATAELDRVQADLEQRKAEWHKQWMAAGLRPNSPDALLEWRRAFVDWLNLLREQKAAVTRQSELQSQVDTFVMELREAASKHTGFADCPADDISRQLDLAESLVQSAASAQRDREQLEEAIRDRQRELADLDRDAAALDSDVGQWTQNWSALLNDLSFPADWDVQLATKILAGLDDARRTYQDSQRVEIRARDMQVEIEQFEQQTIAACRELAPELESLPCSDAVTRLAERLEATRAAELEQKSLERERRNALERGQRCEAEVSRLTAEIDAVLQSAGTSSADEFQQLARQAARRDELKTETEQLERELKRIAGSEDVAEFTRELAATDVDTLEVRRQDIAREHDDIERQRDEALRSETDARNAFREMDGEGRATALRLEQQSNYAQLASAVDQYAPLVLAQALLSRAIERFEREHQPAILADVGSLLRRMTGGRYIGIRRRLDEDETMLIEQHDGKLKTPDQLSTGTREQLYLAIRLAYVQQYCRDSEPLPLVMDDVLVNFDDDRAKQTLDVLFEISHDIQILFLTCHRHTVELARSQRPELQLIELG